jgi:hypothetical protein
MAERRRAVDEALERRLPPATAYPPAIHEAMRCASSPAASASAPSW